MTSKSVTVTRKGKRFQLSFSALPGRTFGPFDLPEAVRDLMVSADLPPRVARDLVLDAHTNGAASCDYD